MQRLEPFRAAESRASAGQLQTVAIYKAWRYDVRFRTEAVVWQSDLWPQRQKQM